MPTPLTAETIVTAPKVLLHDHLDGGLRPATLVDLAARTATTACPTDGGPRSCPLVLRVGLLRIAGALPGDVRAHHGGDADPGVADPGGLGVRAGPGRGRGGLRRDQVRARTAHRAEPHADEVVQAVLDGVRPGPPRRPPAGHRIRARLLLTAMRHAARSREIAELCIAFRDDEVAGFDIAGAEAGFPPTRHLDAFEYLRRENAHFTIHAGEAFGLPSIWEALQWCGADRLGHGVRIVDDIAIRPDGTAEARPACRLCAGQADPAGDGADVERADRRGAFDRRAPDRAAHRPEVPGHRQHRQPADVRLLDDQRDGRAERGFRIRLGQSAVVHGRMP